MDKFQEAEERRLKAFFPNTPKTTDERKPDPEMERIRKAMFPNSPTMKESK